MAATKSRKEPEWEDRDDVKYVRNLEVFPSLYHIGHIYRRQTPRVWSEIANLFRLKEALEEIARDGCGCSTRDKRGSVKTCRQLYKGDRGEWCWSCIAQEALEKYAKPRRKTRGSVVGG